LIAILHPNYWGPVGSNFTSFEWAPKLLKSMDSSQNPSVPGQLAPDPRLQPTPDYGTLGQNSDVAIGAPQQVPATPPAAHVFRVRPLVAVAVGVLLAVLVVNVGSAVAAWKQIEDLLSSRNANPPVPPSARNSNDLDRMQPQEQAETLLELAVSQSEGAVDQISSRVDRWPGKVQWNSRISALSAAALNSSNIRVRESGVEVELAAYGLTKTSSAVDSLVADAASADHAQKIWALWSLGLLANRGVETDHVVQILIGHLKDSDEDSRRWAVEGLALVGSTPTIAPLLRTMHDDPSPIVRERAACSLAESGMLTHEQRFSAIPQLLNYTDDPSLDAQTHAWAFQALGDITRQRLPSESAAWRNWYASTAQDASVR
jgi:hypothetical protein